MAKQQRRSPNRTATRKSAPSVAGRAPVNVHHLTPAEAVEVQLCDLRRHAAMGSPREVAEALDQAARVRQLVQLLREQRRLLAKRRELVRSTVERQGELARQLRFLGLPDSLIAAHLGITQSALVQRIGPAGAVQSSEASS